MPASNAPPDQPDAGPMPLRPNLKRTLLSAHHELLALRSLVDPRLRFDPNAHWLLMFSPPNSGSTALAELISRSARARRLTATGEGQWLIPALSDPVRRMTALPLVSERKLRAVWLHRLRGETRPYVVVEKSPASLFRWRHISAALKPMPQTRLVLVRHPLPTIASWIKRYGLGSGATLGYRPAQAAPLDREGQLRDLARAWLRWGKHLSDCRGEADLFVSYEAMCRDPEPLLAQLKRLVPLLGDVDAQAPLQVKDYRPQPLRNMNQDNLRTLVGSDAAILADELSRGGDVLDQLGYSSAALAD